MAAAAAIRSARSSIPSSGIRNVASKISAGGARNPAASGSPLRSLNQKPLLSHRSIFRSPVELSSCVETTLPYHTATASALLTSMLSATPRTYGWPLEGRGDTDSSGGGRNLVKWGRQSQH